MMRDIRNRKEVSTMNTLEATVSMMKQLPENDLLKIQAFCKTLFSRFLKSFCTIDRRGDLCTACQIQKARRGRES